MPSEARSERMDAVAAHPLAELLECPAEAGNLLNKASQCLKFKEGEMVFQQGESARGLYVAISGRFLRKSERLQSRLTLGPVRPGDLVELAAALSDCSHTYTLTAHSAGSMLLLPMETLRKTFSFYPPLRMKLLEELAREVSRGYLLCAQQRAAHSRRSTPHVSLA
ncbi:Crp/Fnr family transcriptional regulator [Telmatobacter bradus]|uniref:Crp/Fnr family transcriptional regulator n=1 Tax=Telmatobacter bradus TaxID=474953 RepID=UPI003B4372F9